MGRQEGATVVAAPLATVEATLRDVARWPEFLSGLESVRETGFERYVFSVSEGGGHARDVPVCVVPHVGEHRISWRALSGPRYTGELRLRVVDQEHTRVELAMTADPTGLMDGLRELVGERHRTVEIDLGRLDAVVTSRGRSPG